MVYFQVYSATFRRETVAVKVLGDVAISSATKKQFEQEIDVCYAMRSRYVVNFFGACTGGENLALVMEYMVGGSLFDLLSGKTKLPWALRIRMIEEIARGIAVLHTNRPTILHRDLKCANVLLDQEYHCKLADFGLAIAKASTKSKTQASAGTISWMAPELMTLKPKYSTASDIYAFAMIMWEVATRKVPFEEAHNDMVRCCVLDGEREEIPTGCPGCYTDLMQKCWAQNPEERPDIDGVLQAISTLQIEVRSTPEGNVSKENEAKEAEIKMSKIQF